MASKNLTKLHSVKGHRGISFRLRADGSKRFYISFKGSYVSTMDDDITPLLLLGPAIERQGQLTGKRIRGEQVRRPQKVTFAAAAEAYMEHVRRTAPGGRWIRTPPRSTNASSTTPSSRASASA